MAEETASTDTTNSATTETNASATETASAAETTGATTDANAGDDAAATSTLGSATADAGTGDAAASNDKADADGDKGDQASDGPPEAYELKLTDAEGKEAALDPVLVEAATPLLKEAGLTNETANKLIPLVPKVQEQLLKQQQDAYAETKAEWVKEAQADKEIGGKKWGETLALAAKALDHFGAPSELKKDEKTGKMVETNSFRVLLNESGLGEHPDMIRMFRKVGAALAEDNTLARTMTDVKVPKSREEALYPDDVPKKK